jgi:hypothetical protein
MVIFVSKNTENMDTSALFFHDVEGIPAYLITLMPENPRENKVLDKMIRQRNEDGDLVVKRPVIKLEAYIPCGHLVSFKISLIGLRHRVSEHDIDDQV